MAAPPLPGAPYHTADFAFHYCPDVDPEALDSYGPSEKELSTLEGRIHLPLQTSQGTAHCRRGPPVILALLLLCCLAFVVSAFAGSEIGDDFPLPCVPERHASLVDQVSTTFRTKPHTEWVYEAQAAALDILKQKYNSSRIGCHAADVRDYMRRSYPAVKSSLDWTNVSQSAIVLHWQGADRESKPVLITNSDEVLDLEEQGPSTPNHARGFRCDEDVIEHIEDVGDVQSAVGMLTAVETLVRSGYQPSRSLVLSVMLGEAADAQKVYDYLHATYDERGLEMDLGLPPPECRIRRLPKMLYDLFGLFERLYRRVTARFTIPATPHCVEVGSFDDDIPRLFRYVIRPGAPRGLPARGVSDWTALILGTDGQ